MHHLRHLNKYLYKYRWRFLLGILFVTVSNWFAIFPAQLIRYSLDIVKDSLIVYRLFDGFYAQQEYFGMVGNMLLLFALAVIFFSILKGIFMFFMRQTIIVMSRWIEFDLKNEIYAHYQKLDLAFYKRNNTGDMMNRISEDVSRVRMYLGPAIMYTVNLVVLFVLVIITMLRVNAELTFYVLLPMPLLLGLIYYVSNIINRKSDTVQEQLSNLSTYVQETFAGIRVLKANTREKDFITEMEREVECYQCHTLSLAKVEALFHPAMIVLIGLSTILTVYIGGKLAGNGHVTTGNIAEFVYYVNMLTWPVAAVGWVTSLMQRAAASQQRINEFLTTSPDIISSMNTTMNKSNRVSEYGSAGVVQSYSDTFQKGKLEFKDVCFIYPDTGIKALSTISLIVEPGKSLAITGRTGSGKSTIASLICRLYDPTQGQILIDGLDIRTMDIVQLRSNIGYVPQDVFLFSDTIYNNIAFGISNDILPENGIAIEKAAIDAVVYNDISGFQQKFETMVGERGITLSGGQKQRISIARAIVRSPRFLIFDDCLSAVDTETEDTIIRNLKQIMTGKTSLIISHRISAVRHADNIIVLEQGRIVEQGSHTFLLSSKGIYYELYLKQLAEAEQGVRL